MIYVIGGITGSGKTKQLIEMANESVQSAKGTVVFISDGNQYMYDLKRDIRHIDAKEYQINGPKMFFGFLSGIAAQDFDLECIYIDNFLKIVGHPLESLEGLFKDLQEFSKKANIRIIISASYSEDEPEFIKKYLM